MRRCCLILSQFLIGQGALVANLGADELEAGLIGSYSSGGLQAALRSRVHAWQAVQERQGRPVAVEVGDRQPVRVVG